MKKQVFLCISGIFLLIPLLTQASDSQAVYETHLAWKAAFEKMDINAIDKIWIVPERRLEVCALGLSLTLIGNNERKNRIRLREFSTHRD